MRNILIISIGLFLIGCTGYLYVPSPQFVPLNEKKGEIKTNITLNSVQIGYSISNHISIFTTGYYRYRSTTLNFGTALNKENSGAYYRTDSAYELNLGVSYFKKRNNLIYEVLLGSGFGQTKYENIKDTWPDYQFNIHAHKINLFIQPNFGYKFSDLELAIFSKFSVIDYYNIKTTCTLVANSSPESGDKYFIGKKNAYLFFAEPGISSKFGFKYLKFHILASPAINLTGHDIRYRALNLRFSIFLNFDLLEKKEKLPE